MRSSVTLFLNGRERNIPADHALLTLSTWLRQTELAVGTKVVCEEGDCGACTVLVGRVVDGGLKYSAVNSCIQLVGQLDGTHVVTVEGLSRNGELSEMQQTMVACHGAQCGYCTPGFVVAMSALLEEKKSWQERDVRDALTGNLCRCTGYTSIIEAGMQASGKGAPNMNELYDPQPIAARLEQLRAESLELATGAERRFFAPATLEEALRIKSQVPGVVIVQGGTDIGVLTNKRAFQPASLMTLVHVQELATLERDAEKITVGANVTLARLEREVKKPIPAFYEMLRLFGAPQIRNAGTVAGNIANGSPIADTLPFFFVVGAVLELASVRGSRRVDINDFYTGYKTLDLAADELITRIDIPIPSADETVRVYKVSKRRDLDISTFGAAMRMKISGDSISDVRIAFGGVAATVVRLPKTEQFLTGSRVSEETFRAAGEQARQEIRPISDVRGSAEFRLQLAGNVFMKFYDELESGSRKR